MDKNENKAQVQEAPAKNSDNAFVQVGHDGEPVFPTGDTGKKESAKDDEQPLLPDK